MRPTTAQMMGNCIRHAEAQVRAACQREGLARCQVYAGRVWNAGKTLTVIVDRGTCPDQQGEVPMAAVTVWVYEIRGDSSFRYLGQGTDPAIVPLLKELGDAPPPKKSN